MTTATDTSKTEFQKLLGDLETLAKAMPKTDSMDDKKIDAAMKEGEMDDMPGDPEDADDNSELGGMPMKKKMPMKKGKMMKGKMMKGKMMMKDKEMMKGDMDDMDGGDMMGKSLTVTLDDGSEVEALDGTQLVKALTEELGELSSRIESSEGEMTKALTIAVTLLKSQGETLAALQTQIKALGGEGRGRKTMVTLLDRKPEASALAKSLGGEDGIPPAEFLAKAEAGWRNGKVTGQDMCFIESAINNRNFAAIPPSLVSLVAAQ